MFMFIVLDETSNFIILRKCLASSWLLLSSKASARPRSSPTTSDTEPRQQLRSVAENGNGVTATFRILLFNCCVIEP